MPIINQVMNQLVSGEARTTEQLVAMLPELAADPHGTDILRLLLRLDRHLRLQSDGRWTLAKAMQTPEQRIVASAQAYLIQIPRGGALLDSVVAHVVKETGYNPAIVRQKIAQNFDAAGKVVRIGPGKENK